MVKTLLVVEDEEAILGLICEILNDKNDYKVICARDGEEALRISQTDRPDALLLDILLPKINGDEVCKLIKADPYTSQIGVLLLSGISQNAGCQKAKEAGADGFISKPFKSIILLEKIEELLGRKGIN